MDLLAKRQFLVLLFFALIACVARAQGIRVPGYIVLNTKDTVRGYIVDRKDDWRVNSISLSKNETGEPRSYSINDIDVLYLEPYNSFYYSRKVEFDKKPIDVSRLETTVARRFVTEQVLLKLLTGGKLNLFYYMDETSKSHYFLQKDNGVIEELAFVRYMVAEYHSVSELPIYQSTLDKLATECHKVRSTKIPLADKPLIRFVTQYNSCFSSASTKDQNKNDQKKYGILIGVAVGAQLSTPHYAANKSQPTIYEHTKGNFSTVTTPLLGINLEIRPASAARRGRPGLNIFYQDLPNSTKTWQGSSTQDIYEVRMTTIQFRPSYKYMLMTGKLVNPYVKGEAGLSLTLNSESNRTEPDIFGVPTTKTFVTLNGVGYSHALAIGGSIRSRLNVEIRYSSVFVECKPTGSFVINSFEGAIGFMFNK